MSKENLAIIVTAYNRPEALANLLTSLNNIRSDRNITLEISIDNNGTEKVNQIAFDYKWKFGEKIVTVHKEKKGLRDHFIWVGDQTEKYENVIFLEDDLLVSPEIINFVEASIEFYKNDNEIAGICLYNPILCEFNGTKFYQTQDGYDVYFLQHPYWGNIWMKEKWKDFKNWLKTYELNNSIIPKAVSSWKESSFKKIYIQYLIETNKYFVVPRISLLTNMGLAGLHNKSDKYQYQCVLQNEKKEYHFCKLKESKSVYDVYMEILPDILKTYNNQLKKYDFEVDLKGNRHFYKKDYVLTTRKTRSSILSYSCLMKPMENAIIFNVKGEGIYLSKSSDVIINENDNVAMLYKDIDMNYLVGLKASYLLFRNEILKKVRGIFK